MMEWAGKENHIAIITLHKSGIERAHVFELLKPLNITCVFVYCTVKLFSDTGRPQVVHTPQIINAVRSRIN